MIKKLSRVGNSHALILDKPILELLGLEEDGQVQLTIQDGALIVTPTHPQLVNAESITDPLAEIVDRRAELLRRLAE